MLVSSHSGHLSLSLPFFLSLTLSPHKILLPHIYMYVHIFVLAFSFRGKGDAPDRFWATVEPYCADITEADISLLQEDIKNVRVFMHIMYMYLFLPECG